jgi:acetyl-CoA carboxylase carboxyl transferase subunit alpha
MAEPSKPKDQPAPGGRPRSTHTLEFEKPIIDLQKKIDELETLSKSTGMNLNGEVRPLKDRLSSLIRDIFQGLSPWQSVQVARHGERPLASDFIEAMFEEFMELHGDRQFGDDRAIVTGIGKLGGRQVMVIGHRKGHDFKEKVRCNFGSAHPEGYRKALRKMRLAEKFHMPVVTLINTPGAYPGIGAEERGQAWAIAENLRAMAGLKVPIVCVVIGEGGSGGALGIGVGDRVLMLEHAYYSVISPEGCAAILWGDAKRMADAAKALKLTARDLKRLGVIDEVIEEPIGGAHRNPPEMFKRLRDRLEAHFAELVKLSIDDLLAARYEKFRKMGTVFAPAPELAAPKPAPGAPGTS